MQQDIPPTGYYSDIVPLIRSVDRHNLGLEIIGTLSKWKSPELTITFPLSSDTFKAVIDTGAYNNHIRSSLVLDLGLTLPNGIGIGQHPVNGRTETPYFNIDFGFSGYDKIFTDERFDLMIADYQYDVILGSDFLSRCEEFNYYGNRNEFRLIV